MTILPVPTNNQELTTSSVLDNEVPEPTSYQGTYLRDVCLSDAAFNDHARQRPPRNERSRAAAGTKVEPEAIAKMVENGEIGRFIPNLGTSGTLYLQKELQSKAALPTSTEVSQLDRAGLRASCQLTSEFISQTVYAGKRIKLFQRMSGETGFTIVDPPTAAQPRLILVEKYRLTTYLGDYGLGRVLKTFSLLPGEKTKISIKTYRKTDTEAKAASSILDSYTTESANDFENTMQSEGGYKENHASNFDYHAEASAEATWGIGKTNIFGAKASGGVKGGSSATREEFAKNVCNATNKHANKASAKRDVQINTSFERKTSEGEESAIERQIENINLSRTLNFVFRQMNQEFFTLLHLVDVRVAFFNGFAELKREVPLALLDDLLEEYVVPEQRDAARESVVAELRTILDYEDGAVTDFIVPATVGAQQYWHVNRRKATAYKGHKVPGVIIAETTNVMRTDGVVVESILGLNNALDAYSEGLQVATVEEKKTLNRIRELEIRKQSVALTILERGDVEAAKVYGLLYPPPHSH